MTLHTKNYEIFKFLDCNRDISWNHVYAIIDSIHRKNMLEHNPIIINKNYEVIDGQHRLKAAELLNLEIFYKIQDDLDISDMVGLNISRSWSTGDYMHYYVMRNSPEYKKAKEYQEKMKIPDCVFLSLFVGKSVHLRNKFKLGEFVFKKVLFEEEVEFIWEVITFIEKILGRNSCWRSGKFWTAIAYLIKHEDFLKDKLMKNLELNISKLGPRATTKEYQVMLQNIYNYRSKSPIYLIDERLNNIVD